MTKLRVAFALLPLLALGCGGSGFVGTFTGQTTDDYACTQPYSVTGTTTIVIEPAPGQGHFLALIDFCQVPATLSGANLILQSVTCPPLVVGDISLTKTVLSGSMAVDDDRLTIYISQKHTMMEPSRTGSCPVVETGTLARQK